ncbi:uracil-DNA glycosylase family protein [Rickettsiales endosymbiont of Stachyamoeba lipophora]|uniref:uracil-DNA glycosylase family protein n=1 Tax=Rickettsiales endosymbiont of Stachyamoeba lipophora TaxID=2486578 RepID=UPI000F65094E|nr:uracil-DNA glycosylase family protein [Rickettsiales endosymbiont of Stachyamoeba lipophora]AZL15054.1 uracil-DNA glycosylase family protein [Rickettsiales endosymbiont of Stachyamoeba lipophora]
MNLEELQTQITEYIAKDSLSPIGSRPILQISSTAKLLIIGQAPGIRAQTSGIPWNDASGDRLRAWLNLSKEVFYDKNKVAIIPMGFCYPGQNIHGGDRPPNIQHAITWHKSLLGLMPNIKLTLLVGRYAQHYYLQDRAKAKMAETIQAWQEYLPQYLVLPHPSWHNNRWIKSHPWFEQELIPALRAQVQQIFK